MHVNQILPVRVGLGGPGAGERFQFVGLLAIPASLQTWGARRGDHKGKSMSRSPQRDRSPGARESRCR